MHMIPSPPHCVSQDPHTPLPTLHQQGFCHLLSHPPHCQPHLLQPFLSHGLQLRPRVPLSCLRLSSTAGTFHTGCPWSGCTGWEGGARSACITLSPCRDHRAVPRELHRLGQAVFAPWAPKHHTALATSPALLLCAPHHPPHSPRGPFLLSCAQLFLPKPDALPLPLKTALQAPREARPALCCLFEQTISSATSALAFYLP